MVQPLSSRWVQKAVQQWWLRSPLRRQWGVPFAMLVLAATALLSWGQSTVQGISSAPAAEAAQEEECLSVESPASHSGTSTLQIPANKLAAHRPVFEDVDFNRGWRKARTGWVQIGNYHLDQPLPLNLVQRISPLFWAVTLWMFATILLVCAS